MSPEERLEILPYAEVIGDPIEQLPFRQNILDGLKPRRRVGSGLGHERRALLHPGPGSV